jgi:MiaB-like tRNA modifying enzyme
MHFSSNMAKIWVESYGCSASFADAEMISGLIVNGGHTLASSSEDSDLNLIVTCSVKDATANKMVNRIKKLKVKPLVVAGCLAKAEPKTVERFSSGASLMGPNSLGKTLQIIDSTLLGEKTIELSDSDISKIGLPKVRLNPIVGIVEIASGCMSECTFCQTKLAKGDLQSYRIGDIVRQVSAEINDGCKEIWLTSTDNGCYGLDIGTTLPNLVGQVSEIPGDFSIRVGMMNPMYMPRIKDDLAKSFESSKVYKFLHVPVQAGSDKVLNDMKRGHTAGTFRDVVRKFRSKFGKFTISTDIIVGFPTETNEDFAKTMELIEETRPDVVNLSRYSQRPGTKAAEMIQMDVSEVKQRSKLVFELVNKITLENNKEWIGWMGDILFNEQTDGQIRGRNFAYKSVFVDGDVKLGDLKQVEITRATNHGLYGTIAS